jgi:hypothetical protein
MVARSTRAIKRALLKKGFTMRKTHHMEFRFMIGDTAFDIHTFLSHGLKDYGDNLLASMSKQLHLSKTELLRFIDCTMSGAEYAVLMRERGHIA